MSGVLDRMVQRTRGSLPAVEPLVAPQRTALAAQMAPVEETVERLAPRRQAVPRNDAAPARQTPQRAMKAGEDTPPIRPAKTPVTAQNAASPGQLEEPDRDHDRSSSSNQSGSPDQSREALNDVSQQLPSLESETRIRRTETETAGDEAPFAAKSQPVSSGPEPGVEVRTVSASNAESEAHGLKPGLPPIRQAAVPQGDETESRAKPAPRSAAQTSQPALQSEPHAAAPQLEVATEHTEIHITIGKVEMRAPLTEARAPVFRPRVTLDEFLRRRQGAAS